MSHAALPMLSSNDAGSLALLEQGERAAQSHQNRQKLGGKQKPEVSWKKNNLSSQIRSQAKNELDSRDEGISTSPVNRGKLRQGKQRKTKTHNKRNIKSPIRRSKWMRKSAGKHRKGKLSPHRRKKGKKKVILTPVEPRPQRLQDHSYGDRDVLFQELSRPRSRKVQRKRRMTVEIGKAMDRCTSEFSREMEELGRLNEIIRQKQRQRDQYLMRRATRAAVLLQKLWRGRIGRILTRFIYYSRNAIVIQRMVRRVMSRYHYLQILSAIAIQAQWRGFSDRRRVAAIREQQTATMRSQAIVRIQSKGRGYLKRKVLVQKKTAATQLQKIARGKLAREATRQALVEQEIRERRHSAIAIQKQVKLFLQKKEKSVRGKRGADKGKSKGRTKQGSNNQSNTSARQSMPGRVRQKELSKKSESNKVTFPDDVAKPQLQPSRRKSRSSVPVETEENMKSNKQHTVILKQKESSPVNSEKSGARNATKESQSQTKKESVSVQEGKAARVTVQGIKSESVTAQRKGSRQQPSTQKVKARRKSTTGLSKPNGAAKHRDEPAQQVEEKSKTTAVTKQQVSKAASPVSPAEAETEAECRSESEDLSDHDSTDENSFQPSSSKSRSSEARKSMANSIANAGQLFGTNSVTRASTTVQVPLRNNLKQENSSQPSDNTRESSSRTQPGFEKKTRQQEKQPKVKKQSSRNSITKESATEQVSAVKLDVSGSSSKDSKLTETVALDTAQDSDVSNVIGDRKEVNVPKLQERDDKEVSKRTLQESSPTSDGDYGIEFNAFITSETVNELKPKVIPDTAATVPESEDEVEDDYDFEFDDDGEEESAIMTSENQRTKVCVEAQVHESDNSDYDDFEEDFESDFEAGTKSPVVEVEAQNQCDTIQESKKAQVQAAKDLSEAAEQTVAAAVQESSATRKRSTSVGYSETSPELVKLEENKHAAPVVSDHYTESANDTASVVKIGVESNTTTAISQEPKVTTTKSAIEVELAGETTQPLEESVNDIPELGTSDSTAPMKGNNGSGCAILAKLNNNSARNVPGLAEYSDDDDGLDDVLAFLNTRKAELKNPQQQVDDESDLLDDSIDHSGSNIQKSHDDNPEMGTRKSECGIPELGSNDGIPELGSNDGIPELGSNDGIPEIRSEYNFQQEKEQNRNEFPDFTTNSINEDNSGFGNDPLDVTYSTSSSNNHQTPIENTSQLSNPKMDTRYTDDLDDFDDLDEIEL